MAGGRSLTRNCWTRPGVSRRRCWRAGFPLDRPIVILSGNSIDHARLAFGALYSAGIPFCPISPAYSLVSKDYGKLAFAMKLLMPGLVFADDAGIFAGALHANVPDGIEIAAARGALPVLAT